MTMKDLAKLLAQAHVGTGAKPTRAQLRNALWDVETAIAHYPFPEREQLEGLNLDREDILQVMVETYYLDTFNGVISLPADADDDVALAVERLAAEAGSHEPENLLALDVQTNPSANLRASAGPGKGYKIPVYIARITVQDTVKTSSKRLDALLKKITEAIHDYEPAMAVDLWLTQGPGRQINVSVVYAPDDTRDIDRAESVFGIVETALGWVR